jgi:signal transduction histidine kinase
VRRLVRTLPPQAVDAALAVVFTVVGVLEPLSGPSDGFDAGPPWLTVSIGVFMGVPLAVRRRAPAFCLLTMSAALLLPSLVVAHGEYFWSQQLPLCLAVYPAARALHGWLGRLAWLFPLLAVEADVLHSVQARAEGGPWLPLLLFGGSAVAGRLARRSAAEAAELAVALKRLTEEQSAREQAAVQDERTRIAVEMHDVVAHAVSVMVLQVGAARLGLEQHGHPVPEQLRAAETTGRQALAELRHSVGTLSEDPSPLQPLPGLDDLAALVERFRTAGLEVGLEVAVGPELPAGLQLSVYRLVQEGLTNAVKHAGQVRVTGAVRTEGEEVVVELINATASPAPAATGLVSPGGHGLLGMRERVAMYGGELVAGVRDGSFELRARMPVPVGPSVAPGSGLMGASL